MREKWKRCLAVVNGRKRLRQIIESEEDRYEGMGRAECSALFLHIFVTKTSGEQNEKKN